MVIKEKRASTGNETKQERDLSGCTIASKQIRKTRKKTKRKNKIKKRREKKRRRE